MHAGGMIQLKAGHTLPHVEQALATMQHEIMNLILRIAAEFTDRYGVVTDCHMLSLVLIGCHCLSYLSYFVNDGWL
jgi:hypothetical protein